MKPEKAKWIWLNSETKKDEYAVFLQDFEVREQKTVLKISADSNYTVWVNGKMAGFGQYPDYPHYKVFEKIDITNYLLEGENTLAIEAWYFGASSSTYICGEAGLWFDIHSETKMLCVQ